MSDVRTLKVVLQGSLSEVIIAALRTRPLQRRSIASVERVLAAALRLTSHSPRAHPNLQTISIAAGVTPQAAYRYFRDADEAIDLAFRYLAIQAQEEMAMQLASETMTDNSALIRAIIHLVSDSGGTPRFAPPHVRGRARRIYRDVGIDASPLIAALICQDARADDVRQRVTIGRLSTGLAAAFALAELHGRLGTKSQDGADISDILALVVSNVFRTDAPTA